MLLLYIPTNTARCQYVLEMILTQELGIEYHVTTDQDLFEKHTGEKINYSHSRIENSFFINAAPLLFEKGIKKQNIVVALKDDIKIIFPNEDCDLGFDIFSAVFYMISRYEEYLSFTPDKDGRFKASDSLAFKNDFLHLPVVNIWVAMFKTTLCQRFPAIKIKDAAFNAIATYDIDVAYKFRGRSIFRTLGSAAKDILKFNLPNIYQRIITLLNLQKDPWDVYAYVHEITLKAGLKPIFFFLMADKSVHDRNLDHKNPWMKKVINQVMKFGDIGIHPSYTTSDFPDKIEVERNRLEQICGDKIIKSRQHYLKFVLPGTYRALTVAGITEDYSMGFSEMAGFRAGTCSPFYFYDLEDEKATRLKLFPVTLMEGSFMENQIAPEQSLRQIFNFINEVKKVQGTFISIWHNHTVSKTSEYKEWRKIHGSMISALREISHKVY